MVRCRTDALTEADISNEAQVTVRNAVCAVLRLKKHLQHGNEIASHLAAVIATLLFGLFKLACVWIGRLGARIHDLRHQYGYKIETRTGDDNNTVYRLISTPKPQQQSLLEAL